MSLRFVHIFFILAADLLCTFFGVWGIRRYWDSQDRETLLLGIGSMAVSVFLVFYLVGFIKRSKGMSS